MEETVRDLRHKALRKTADCIVCGKAFSKGRRWQRFCGADCRTKYWREWNRKAREAYAETVDPEGEASTRSGVQLREALADISEPEHTDKVDKQEAEQKS